MEIVCRQADLPQIVRALCTPRRLAGTLHGRQQQRHQDPDDANHYQQLDEGEPPPLRESRSWMRQGRHALNPRER